MPCHANCLLDRGSYIKIKIRSEQFMPPFLSLSAIKKKEPPIFPSNTGPSFSLPSHRLLLDTHAQKKSLLVPVGRSIVGKKKRHRSQSAKVIAHHRSQILSFLVRSHGSNLTPKLVMHCNHRQPALLDHYFVQHFPNFMLRQDAGTENQISG